ncbi:dynein light chain Tctex-type 4 [Episyrphus balteatus]|uniref:dynein light chain Tctex-type 4 n=1 Tax=Episyrphus balteatus TaxID=286459 RepID=UPI002485BC6B|nr:dynein light chain Tctex-type 4 [Episyrphus balteatus]
MAGDYGTKENGRSSRSTSHRMSLFLGGGTPKPAVPRYMPTYRLEAHNPLNREQCENIMKAVMDKAFEDFIYSSKQAQDLCQHISEEIKTRVKEKNYDRYRLICVVTIGEKCMQGFKSVVTFLWDAEKDGYIKYAYDTPDFFANATLYYLYYD